MVLPYFSALGVTTSLFLRYNLTKQILRHNRNEDVSNKGFSTEIYAVVRMARKTI
jgi:hypothetical protein